ncbi:MAG: hypothetical protein IKT92_00365 [Bacteroidaceae bacterium]|nr:hypothetical protein [Bacteroidaceae bacterium]
MKKKILSLLAAFFMLFGTSAMAQVDSTLEGDVNGDGVVDIADITAVIAIIKQNAEANPTYYWYVGKENPASIDTSKEGWTELGTDLTSITKIQIDTSNNPDYNYPNWFVLIPTSLGFKPYNADGSKDESALWTSSTSTINGYTLWSLNDAIDSINTQFKK